MVVMLLLLEFAVEFGCSLAAVVLVLRVRERGRERKRVKHSKIQRRDHGKT